MLRLRESTKDALLIKTCKHSLNDILLSLKEAFFIIYALMVKITTSQNHQH